MSVSLGAERGATMLEVLIAVVIVTVTVAFTSLVIPKAAKSITNSRQRLLANNLATSRMQELKAVPYPLLVLTDPLLGAPFPTSGTGANGCDCKAEDLSGVAPEATFSEDGITYLRRVCINLVEGAANAWTPHCPNNPLDLDDTRDKGLKNIRIQVSWVSGSQTFETEVEGLVTR